jgi:hypothetical protein
MSEQYVIYIISGLLAVINILLRGTINDMKTFNKEVKAELKVLDKELTKTNTELGKTNGRLALVESETLNRIGSLEALSTQQFKNIGETLTRLEAIVVHSDQQAKSNAILFTTLIEELTKEKK